MAGNYPTDYHAIFDHYIYDYLKKNNMHETAESFRNEANLTIDQVSPPGVDVEEGFLREWWNICNDVSSSRHSITAQRDEGSSSRANQANIMHQSYPESSTDREVNEEMIHELTVGSDVGIIIDGNLVPLGSPSIKNEEHSEDSACAEVVDESAELSILLAEIFDQKTDDMACDEGGDEIPEIERIILNMFYVEEDPDEGQSGTKMNNCVESKDERISVKLVNYSSSSDDEKGDSSFVESRSCTAADSHSSNTPTVERSKRKR